jgi:hypothetical protein
MYGADRLRSDLVALGHPAERKTTDDGQDFVIVPSFTVELGRFAGRVIGLGLYAPPDYPRTVASAIHVRSNPHLLDVADSVPNVRNIQGSPLGDDWRYWSRNFAGDPSSRTTQRLLAQINEIFRNV